MTMEDVLPQTTGPAWLRSGFLSDVVMIPAPQTLDREEIDGTYMPINEIEHPSISNVKHVKNANLYDHVFDQSTSIPANTCTEEESNILPIVRWNNELEEASQIIQLCEDPEMVDLSNAVNLQNIFTHPDLEHVTPFMQDSVGLAWPSGAIPTDLEECSSPLIVPEFQEQQLQNLPQCEDPSDVEVSNTTNMEDVLQYLNFEDEAQDNVGRTPESNASLSNRKRLSEEQRSILRNWYISHSRNPDDRGVGLLVRETGLEWNKVKGWFKNERTKELNSAGDILKRSNCLPDPAIAVMNKWLDSHLEHPKPTREKREKIAKEAKLGPEQVYYWFENYRKRKLRDLKIEEN